MSQNSKIEWTDHTANPWWGCTKVHEGCNNCYAEKLAKRWGNNLWGNEQPRKVITSFWNTLQSLQKSAAKNNRIERVFVGSMMDIFEKPMNVVDAKGNQAYCNSSNTWKLDTGLLRDELFNNIDLGLYENLMFLFLTKRPSNINKFIPQHWTEEPPANVMFGTSPVNQPTFDNLVRQLKEVKGKKFLSVEPQLDSISIGNLTGIDWIIQGGESGPGKRPFNVEWARSMRDECKKTGIPYFFKQIDKKQVIPEDLQVREFPNA